MSTKNNKAFEERFGFNFEASNELIPDSIYAAFRYINNNGVAPGADPYKAAYKYIRTNYGVTPALFAMDILDLFEKRKGRWLWTEKESDAEITEGALV